MSAGSRSCRECSKAKRKCEKSLPSCRRCRAKHVPCHYPPPRPSPFVPVGMLLELEPNELPLQDAAASVLSTDEINSLAVQEHIVNSYPSQTEKPRAAWFLSPRTWAIDHRAIPIPSTFPKAELTRFMGFIQDWLKQWVESGSNPFIHSRLYSEHFPSSVQTAYSTLSMYLHKTTANSDIVLQIINERLKDLVTSHTPDAEKRSRSVGITEQLGRVHALLVYQTICLLDGDIRSRDVAESCLSVLTTWLSHMIKTSSATISQSYFTREITDAVMTSAGVSMSREHVWQAWAEAESARRTWMIGMGFCSAYLALKQGWVPCPGGIAFTHAEGVWDAKSAYAWERLCIERNVHFMPRFDAESLLVSAAPEEVDEFGKKILEITFGMDRTKDWLATALK